ncbi:MAG: ATP-binding protein [Candidatus Binatia bacterium]
MQRKLLRLHDQLLRTHLATHRQMALVSGPRQVGKTTTCRALASPGGYLSWDDPADRRTVLAGWKAIAEQAAVERLRETPLTLVLDELHKFGRWKAFLKGLFDGHAEQCRIVVTGSSRLDVYRRGGDSLMGRYLLYRMHPLSVAELARPEPPEAEVRPPVALAEPDFAALWNHGGYPEPFLKRDTRFSLRWRELRRHQLLREDIRDLTRIRELDQMEVLERLLAERSAGQIVLAHLANEVKVSVDTVRRWLGALASLHHGFLVRPWWKNVAKSLRKEPKWFATDWSGIEDPGARAETFVACQLWKAVQGWQDIGLGVYELRYLRDKEKREVDLLVVRNRRPWFLVEVKHRDTRIAPTLEHFQRQTRAEHAFQVVLEEDYVDADCFARRDPCVVPGRTFLSQLL